MGIHKLWEILRPCVVPVSLNDYTKEESLKRRNLNANELVLGVDLRMIMSECTAATLAAGIHGQFQGGALRIFFTKLCNYRKAFATLVFVLDGNGRPSVKRGVQVVNRDMWWTQKAGELIESFGFYWYQAPGEAEAELAHLNRLGLIHGIITGDSDAFIFGAQRVFRTIPRANRTSDDEMHLYTADSIFQTPTLTLTLGGLLLFALLAGGDYDDGVRNCGARLALELAKCGYGDELYDAIKEGKDIDRFLVSWRQKLCNELKENPHKRLTSRHPAISSSFPPNFPDRRVLDLYINPLTSWSEGQIPPTTNWIQKEPNIEQITDFCRDNLGWKKENTLKKYLYSHLWESVFCQMLYSPFLHFDPTTKVLETPNAQVQVLSAKWKARQGKMSTHGRMPRIVISVDGFVERMGHNYRTPTTVDKLPVWVSRGLLPDGVIQSDGSKDKLASKRKHTSEKPLQSQKRKGNLINKNAATTRRQGQNVQEGPSSIPLNRAISSGCRSGEEVIEIDYTSSSEDHTENTDTTQRQGHSVQEGPSRIRKISCRSGDEVIEIDDTSSDEDCWNFVDH